MPLVVLDPSVLVGAIEGRGYGAQLLALLAYGRLSDAVDEQSALQRYAAEHPDWEIKGPPVDIDLIEAQWVKMDERLKGLPDDWRLATTGRDLETMRSELEIGRAHTLVNPYRAWRIVGEVVAATVSERQLEDVQADLDATAARPTLVALATGADYVVHRQLPQRSSGSVFGGRVIGPVIEQMRASARRGPPERTYTSHGRVIRHLTLPEFRLLDEAPAVSRIANPLELLEAVFPPPGGSMFE